MASSTSLTRTVPNLLFQPFTIAALASVGIHGLLAANIEKISLFPRTVELPPSVGLIELSPLQISRLYPAPPAKLSLSTIAPPPSLATLGSSPTLPSFPGNLSTPSFPTFPTSPTLPPVSSSLPPISSPTYRPVPSFPIPTTPPSIPIPNNLPPFFPAPEFQDKNDQELNRLRDRQLAFENLSPEERAIIENMEPEVYSSNIFRSSPVAEEDENYGIPPQRYVNLNPETETTAREETPVEPPSPKGSLLAKLQRDLNSTPAQSNANPQQAMVNGGNAFVAWAGQLTQSYPNLEAKPPQTLSSFYPAAACPQELRGEATVGVVMGPGGQVLDGPTLLSGSSHSILDDAAVQKVGELAVTQLAGEVGSQPTAFWYGFEFNPDNCAAVQPASEATPQPPVTLPETEPEVENIAPPPIPVEPEVERSPVETEPEVENITPPPMPVEPEVENSPVETEPEVDNITPPPMPTETEVERSPVETEPLEQTPPPTPTEHKGSLLDSLTTPYTEPEE